VDERIEMLMGTGDLRSDRTNSIEIAHIGDARMHVESLMTQGFSCGRGAARVTTYEMQCRTEFAEPGRRSQTDSRGEAGEDNDSAIHSRWNLVVPPLEVATSGIPETAPTRDDHRFHQCVAE